MSPLRLGPESKVGIAFFSRDLSHKVLIFAGVFLVLALWRIGASVCGFLVDDGSGLDWIHRTFMLTTVYTCGSAFICNSKGTRR